jgi:4-hydroxythreonine-4-phosphate dehydrogenase
MCGYAYIYGKFTWMSLDIKKPVIGISIGDINGIGTELIIKALSDPRILELFTPVIFGSGKVLNFYRKSIPEINFNYHTLKDLGHINPKMVNLLNCWEEDINITPGQLTEVGGRYAIKSLFSAVQALKNQEIDGLVTAPIHKSNVQSAEFPHTGHTPYLKAAFQAPEALMLMTAPNLRVGLVTEHVPIKDVAQYITRENITSKITVLHEALRRDFGIEKPKIAVLGLNPHAGDEGLIGKEEETIIKPTIKDLKHHNMLVFGPYSADAFFARGQYEKFDAVLAMYHDQGLIPFKYLDTDEGVNFTAGLKGVRTSPDHGTAFDIAGKNKGDSSSLRAAIFSCIDVVRQRWEFTENHKNPLKKISAVVIGNVVDERGQEE